QDATEYGRFGDQRAYDTEAARYTDSLIQQSFNNAQQTRQLNENSAQLALENSRYDTEYADLLKQRAVENALNAQNTASLIASRNAAGAADEDLWDVDLNGDGADNAGANTQPARLGGQAEAAYSQALRDLQDGRSKVDVMNSLNALVVKGVLTAAQAAQIAAQLGF
ncbi:MAG: hypothetical protein LBK23_04910, partial [Oscillospiraceae bacterium]|nr:hypothetical protein [Oscillospiraceae bacterium]